MAQTSRQGKLRKRFTEASKPRRRSYATGDLRLIDQQIKAINKQLSSSLPSKIFTPTPLPIKNNFNTKVQSWLAPILACLVLITALFLIPGNPITALVGIEIPNAAPIAIQPNISITLTKNVAFTLDVAAYFSDPDQDTLTYISTEDPSVNTTLSGSLLTLQPLGEWNGTRILTIIASDLSHLTRANLTLTVSPTLSDSQLIAVNAPFPIAPEIARQIDLFGEATVLVEMDLSTINHEKKTRFTILKESAGLLQEPSKKELIEKVRTSLLKGSQREEASLLEEGGSPILKKSYDTIPVMMVSVTTEGLRTLSRKTGIKAIHADSTLTINLADSLPLIFAQQAWNMTLLGTNLTGAGQAICILDTGIDTTHPAFSGRLLPGFDFVDNDDNPSDNNGHGTHVAGIAASTAPGSMILPIRVCNQDGQCKSSDVISAIDFCINATTTANISTISGSFGDGIAHPPSTCLSTLETALYEAIDANITLVFASGNGGSTTGVQYPACSPYSISVGAIDKVGDIAGFSDRGPGLDIFAPGVNINSTIPGGAGIKSGTSMAAPFVAGGAAILRQYGILANLSTTPLSIEQAIVTGGTNTTGWPILSLTGAITALITPNQTPTIPSPNETGPAIIFQTLANPVASLVNITPFTPNRSTSVAGVWNYSDADGNAENGTTWTWFVNGTEVWKDSSLVGYWRFDQDAVDVIGQNNGTITGGVTNTSGLIKSALTFDSGNSFVNLTSNPSSTPFNFTFTAWIKAQNSISLQFIASARQGAGPTNNEGWELYLGNGTTGFLQVTIDNGTAATGTPGTRNIRDNAWHHIAVVRNGSLNHVFVDGTIDDNGTTSVGGRINTTTAMLIGKSANVNDNANRRFNGTIDEVKLYNRSLTPTEIWFESQIMGYGSTEKEPQTGTPAPDIPLLLYHFEETGNTSVMDYFGDMNGTWNGSAAEFVQGMYGTRGASFNGIHRFINISPYIDKLNFSGAATMEAWVSSTTDSCQAIFNLGNTSADASPSLGIFIGDSCTSTLANEIVLVQRINHTNINSRYGFTTSDRNILLDGNLHHLALTFNTTTTRIFIDGIERAVTVGSGVNDGSFTGFPALGANRMAYIGVQDAAGIFTRFNGTLDEYAIYSRALTPNEINQSFRRGFPKFGLNASKYGPGTRLRFQIEPIEFNGTTGLASNSSTIIVESARCGSIISENETLTTDLNATDSCLTINAANQVVLDCNGYTIRGNGTSTLINATAVRGLIIRNCNFVNATIGIGLVDVNDTLILNNNFTNASIRTKTSGSWITPNRNLTLTGNFNITDAELTAVHFSTIENSSIQTLTGLATNNSVRNTNLTRSATFGGANNTITQSLIGASTTPANILLISGSDQYITNNTVQSGNIVIQEANTTTFRNNTLNSACIINGSGARTAVIIESNTIYNCTGDSIQFLGLNQLFNISNNLILSPTGIGIRMNGATDLFILNNTINSTSALSIRNTNRTLIANNSIDAQWGSNSSIYITNTSNMTILENIINNITSPGAAIHIGLETPNTRAERITIRNNTLANVETGIQVGNQSETLHGQPLANVTTVTIDLNTIINTTHAIALYGDHPNITINDVNISRNEIITSAGFGILVRRAFSVSIWQNSLNSTTLGGIAVVGGSQNISLANNTIRQSSISILIGNSSISRSRDDITHNSTESGLHINASVDTKITNITILQSNTTIRIQDSPNTTINQTNASLNVVIENSTAARINFTQNISFGVSRPLIDMVNITRNRVIVNSTLGPQFNRTAIITMFNINLTNPVIERSLSDTQDFETCPSTVCQVMDSGGADYTFNVTQFTSYRITGTESLNSTITNSNLANSTIFSSNVSNSTATSSIINTSTIDNSTIIRSNISFSTINRSRIENSRIHNSTATIGFTYNTTIDNSTIERSNITLGLINRSMLSNSTITNSTVISSVINTSTISNSSTLNSTIVFSIINSSQIHNSTVNASNITDSVLNVSSIRNSTAVNTTIRNGIINQTHLTNSTIIFSNASHSSINNSNVNTARVFNSSIQSNILTNSTILNSSVTGNSVLNCLVNNSLIITSTLFNCTVLDSTLNRSTAENVTVLRSNASDTVVNASAVDLSSLFNSSVDSSIVNQSFLSNSTSRQSNITLSNITLSNSENASILNSTLASSQAEAVILDNSSMIRTNVTYKIINASRIDSSNITNTTIDRSLINASSIRDSTISIANTTNALISNATVTNSTMQTANASTVSVVDRSAVENSTVVNTTIGDSTIFNSYLEQSGLSDTNLTRSFANQSNLDLLNAINSSIVNTFSNNSVLDNSTITNSSILLSTINRTIITNLNITNSSLFQSTINQSTFDNSSSSFSNLSESFLNSTNIIDGSTKNSTISSRTRIFNSSISNSTLAGINATMANITGSTITNSTIENSTSIQSHINSSIIFNTTIINSTVAFGVINKTILNASFLVRSNVSDNTIRSSTIDTATIQNSSISGGIINNSIIDNTTLANSSIVTSMVNGSTIENSTVTNSSITILNGTDASLTYVGSFLNASAIHNSTLRRSNITRSISNTSHISNSTILNSSLYISFANGSTIENSSIRFSNLSRMVLNASQIDWVSTTNSTLTLSIANQTVIDNSTIINASVFQGIINSSVLRNSTATFVNSSKTVINDSLVQTLFAVNSTISGGLAYQTILNNSVSKQSTLGNSSLSNSTVDSSTINATTLNSSTTANSTILNSTIINSTITNSSINRSFILNANLSNVTIHNSSIVGETIRDAAVINNQLVLTSCGTNITRPSRIETNLSCNGAGLIVRATNTILDCNNNTIHGDSTGVGINISNQANVTVSTCIISNFSSGILLTLANKTLITTTSINDSTISIDVNISRDVILNNLRIGNQSPSEVRNSPNISISGTILPSFTVFSNESWTSLNYTGPVNATITMAFDTGIRLTNTTIFVNSTLFPGLNQTALLRFQNTNIINPAMLVDPSDSGTFEGCPNNLCTLRSAAGGIIVFNVSHLTTFSVADNVVNSSVINSTLNYSSIDNSTIIISNISGSIINRSIIQNSTIDTSNVTDAVINVSLVNLSHVLLSNISNSTVILSTVNSSTLLNSSLRNSTIVRGEINNSIISNSTITNSSTTLSIINSSIISNSSILRSNITTSVVNQSTIQDSTNTNGTVFNSRIHNASITNSTITNSTTFNNQINSSNLDRSTLDRTNITESNINNSITINGSITNSTILGSVINQSLIDDSRINYTNASRSIVNQSSVSTSAISNSTLILSTLTNGTIDNSTAVNATIEQGTLVNASAVSNSSITSSNLSSSYTNASVIRSSQILNSTALNLSAENSTVYNSTITDSVSISSTINASRIINSSRLINSSINASTILNSTLTSSTSASSSINATAAEYSTITDGSLNFSFLANATIRNSYASNSSIINSSVRFSNITNSSVTNTTINLSQVLDSKTPSSTILSSNVLNSSSINSSMIANNSRIINSTILNSTIINSTIQNENISHQIIVNGLTIPTCGQVVTRNATIARNTTTNNSCLTLSMNAKLFDCAGFAILGNQTGFGINNTGVNTTIRNCIIQQFETGIILDGSENTTLTNVSIVNSSIGITFLNNSVNNRIVNQSFRTTGVSLSFFDSFQNTIIDSLIPSDIILTRGRSERINITGGVNFTTPIRFSDVIRMNTESIFVNVSQAPVLNTTASLTFFNSRFFEPNPTVDLADNGTYTDCISPRCTILTTDPENFTYRVNGFTTYSLREGRGPPFGGVPQSLRGPGGAQSYSRKELASKPQQAQPSPPPLEIPPIIPRPSRRETNKAMLPANQPFGSTQGRTNPPHPVIEKPTSETLIVQAEQEPPSTLDSIIALTLLGAIIFGLITLGILWEELKQFNP